MILKYDFIIIINQAVYVITIFFGGRGGYWSLAWIILHTDIHVISQICLPLIVLLF